MCDWRDWVLKRWAAPSLDVEGDTAAEEENVAVAWHTGSVPAMMEHCDQPDILLQ